MTMIDVKVHPIDAARLMVHHLKLASALFELTESEHGPIYAEMARELEKDLHLPAARQWFATLVAAYDALDQEGPAGEPEGGD